MNFIAMKKFNLQMIQDGKEMAQEEEKRLETASIFVKRQLLLFYWQSAKVHLYKEEFLSAKECIDKARRLSTSKKIDFYFFFINLFTCKLVKSELFPEISNAVKARDKVKLISGVMEQKELLIRHRLMNITLVRINRITYSWKKPHKF